MTQEQPTQKKTQASAFVRFWARFGRGFAAFVQNPKHTLILCFLAPFVLLFLSHAVIGVFPFGPMSVLTLDLNGQYVYFFTALRDFVYGEGSLLYSFVRGMGGEFMGIYAYYIASPLSYLVCLFPKAMMPEAMYLLLVLKAGLCGLSFGFMMRKMLRLSPFHTLLLSTAYALSGYVTAQQSNTMWIDAVYLLPLVVYGMYCLIQNRRVWLYTLSLTLLLLFNYYIGYMTCFCILLGFFALYFGISRKKRNPLSESMHFWRTLLRMGVYSAIAILMAAVILIPALYSLTFGKNDFTSPVFSMDWQYDPFLYYAKFLLGSFDTFRPTGLPTVYCGLFTLLLFPLFFLAKSVPLREKLAGGGLFGALFVISNIQGLDLVLHGGQEPNWMNCRYSFCLIFVLLFCIACLFKREIRLHPAVPLITGGIVTAFTASLFFFKNEDMALLLPLCISIPVMIGYSVFFFLYLKDDQKKRLVSVTVLTVGLVELFASAVITLLLIHGDVAIVKRSRYTNMETRFQDIVDYVKETDDDPFYRMEKTVIRKLNDGYQLGYYGLSGSTSTLNAEQIEFLSWLGYSADSIYTQYCFPSIASDTLLGVKYIFTEPAATVSGLYKPVYAKIGGEIVTLDENASLTEENGQYFLLSNNTKTPLDNAQDVVVYENPYALSLGFTVHEDLGSITFTQPEIDDDGNWILPDGVTYCSPYAGTYKTVFTRLNRIYEELTGGTVTDIFLPVSYTTETVNAVREGSYRLYKKQSASGTAEREEKFQSYNYARKDEAKEGKVEFTFKGIEGQHIYMYIPAQTFTETTFTVNGESEDTYFSTLHYGIYDLGVFNAGESVTVSFSIPKDKKVYMGRDVSYFYTMDEDAFQAAHALIQNRDVTLTEFHDDGFTATVDGGTDGKTVLTTIPYDEGWHILVDGAETESTRLLDACLAFSVPEGTHDVSFYYFPDCYAYAILLSALGCELFLLLLFLRCHFRKKKAASLSDTADTAEEPS